MNALKKLKWLRSIASLRGAIVLGGIVLVALVGWICFRAGIVEWVYVYSDRDTLREVSGAARPRSVLWSPPREMPEPEAKEAGLAGSSASPGASPLGTIVLAKKTARGDFDLFLRELSPGGWTASRLLEGINSPADDLDPVLAASGTDLYFASNRPGGLGGYDLYLSRRVAGGWEEPINLGSRVNSPYDDAGPSIHPGGLLLLFSTTRPESFLLSPPAEWSDVILDNWRAADPDLVYSLRIGEGEGSHWSAPRFLAEIASSSRELEPCFSPSGDFLYFSSDRPGGLGGLDIYRSRSRLEGVPQKGSAELLLEAPENIGRPVNSPLDDHAPKLFLEGFAMAYQVSDPQKKAEILLETRTREVDSEIQFASIPLRVLGAQLARLIFLALAGLLLLAVAILLFRYRALWRLNLVARCAALAILVHVAMLYGFYFWVVGDEIVALAQKEAPLEVHVEKLLQAKITLEANRLAVDAPETVDPPGPPSPSGPDDVAALAGRAAAPPPVVLHGAAPPEPRELAGAVEVLTRPFEARQFLPALDAPDGLLPPAPEGASLPSPEPTAAADEASPSSFGALASLKVNQGTKGSPPGMVSENAPSSELAGEPALPPAVTQVENRAAESVFLPPLARSPSEAAPAVTSLPVPAQAPIRSPALSLAGEEISPKVVPGRLSRPLGDGRAPPVLESGAPSILETTEIAASAPGPEPRQAGILATPQDLPGARPFPESPFPPLGSLPQPMPTAAAGSPLKLPQSAPRAETASKGSASAGDAFSPRPVEGRPSSGALLLGAPASHLQFPEAIVESRPRTAPADARSAITAASPGRLGSKLEPGTVDPLLTRAQPAPASAPRSLPERRSPRQSDQGSPEVADILSPRASEGRLQKESFKPDDRPRRDAGQLRFEPAAVGLEPSRADALSKPMEAAPNDPLGRTTPEPEPGDRVASAVRLPEAPPDLRGELDLKRIRSSGARKVLLAEMGGTKASEDAVALALGWLSRHQAPDGHWDVDDFDQACQGCRSPGFQADCDAAITGLAVLCFLGQNHTPASADSPFRKNVGKAVEWILSIQKGDGNLAGADERYTMYSHSMAALALSETYSLTRNEALREPLQRALSLIISSQNKTTGGWRYRPQPPLRGDTSITGWQVLVLTSARWAGLEVEEGVFDRARHWLDVEVGGGQHGGIYGYSTREEPRVAMVAEGLYARLLLGATRTERNIEEAARYLHSETRSSGYLNNLYLLYYGNLALYNYQGWIWEKWNGEVREYLIRSQERSGSLAGSWSPSDPQCEAGGRVLSTCFATLALEVYYRYLPLYWRLQQGGKPSPMPSAEAR
jgi:hypothetical protein